MLLRSRPSEVVVDGEHVVVDGLYLGRARQVSSSGWDVRISWCSGRRTELLGSVRRVRHDVSLRRVA